jgi:hypothetical protein
VISEARTLYVPMNRTSLCVDGVNVEGYDVYGCPVNAAFRKR